MANYQAGGSFLPEGDMLLKGTVTIASGATLNSQSGATITLTGVTLASGATLNTATLTGTNTINGTTNIGTGATLTGPTLVAPTINGAATIASGATLTTPTMSWTSANVTATGTGATDATVLPAVYPAYVTITTGATGSGVALPAASAVTGALYIISNQVAATMRIYSSGATINGTTGTTAFTVTNTGNKTVIIGCTVAGAWTASGNT